MPLYATRCTECDNRKDVLVRSHDAPLPDCHVCGAERERVVSAPNFNLKGTGWFRPGASK